MKDEVLVRIAAETASLLDEMGFQEDVQSLVASYNAVLREAKQNHADNRFLQSIETLERSEGKQQLQILFTQLRIALEALKEDQSSEASDPRP